MSPFAAEALAEGVCALTGDPARAAVLCDIDGTPASVVDQALDALVADGRLDSGVIPGGRGVRHGPAFHGNMRSQYAAVPPSTLYAEPVMPAATSDASRTATAATSSTVLIRLSAVSWANRSTI